MENVEIFEALASDYRLQILFWLKNPGKYFVHEENVDVRGVGVCVGKIQKQLGLTQSTASHYLSMLQEANLSIATRIGKWTCYRCNKVAPRHLRDFINKGL